MTIEDPTFQFLQTLGLLDKLETKQQLSSGGGTDAHLA
jgi:hypothetical protein